MRGHESIAPSWTTREVVAMGALAGVWALAPVFGASSRIWLMPVIAVFAAGSAVSMWRAFSRSLVALLVLVLPWSAAAVFTGAVPASQQVAVATMMLASYAPVVVAFTLGAYWMRGRLTRVLSGASD